MSTNPPDFDPHERDAIGDMFQVMARVVDYEEDILWHAPTDWVCFTDAQHAMYQCADREALWVDGNQLGKSFEQACDIVTRARGQHPSAPGKAPVEIVVMSVSFEQMVPLMEKIWEALPKDEIDPEVAFTKGRGFAGKPPRVHFTSGPGKGSLIKFATYEQGAKRIAGLTADMVILDEPPTEGIYGEIRPRLLRKRGILRVTMTPTPDMPPQLWYKKKVEAGEVTAFNFGVTEDQLVARHWLNPAVGAWVDGQEWERARPWPRPFLTQAELDVYEAGLLEAEREMRMRGAWSAAVEGRMLPAFDQHIHVKRIQDSDVAEWYLTVGVDHGAQEGKQAAMLVALKDRGSTRPKVRFLAEVPESETYSTPEEDVEAIVDMLASRGLQYVHVDQWVGDVPTGSVRYAVKKSNKLLRRELANLLGIKMHQVKPFHTPRKGRNSMTFGVRFLNTLFARREEDGTPHALVDPSCERFIAFCLEFDGDKWHTTKDAGDAGRYAVERGCDMSRAVSS